MSQTQTSGRVCEVPVTHTLVSKGNLTLNGRIWESFIRISGSQELYKYRFFLCSKSGQHSTAEEGSPGRRHAFQFVAVSRVILFNYVFLDMECRLTGFAANTVFFPTHIQGQLPLV